MSATQDRPLIFDGDDEAYQQWIHQYPRGYVINVPRNLDDPSYMVLHLATCWMIRKYTERATPGAFTERGFLKVCSTNLDSLREWVRNSGRPSGSFSKICATCHKAQKR